MHTAAQQQSVPARTVLLVDDNSSVRASLRDLFLSAGFKMCIEAENGFKAIELAQVHTPDLIILDVVMPVMTGIDAAPRLKALLPDTPIIIFSLHAAFIKQEQLTELGVAAAFMKGDPLDKLLEKANELIGK
jgi:two-component system, response regulator, stage 0 sporulation protein F